MSEMVTAGAGSDLVVVVDPYSSTSVEQVFVENQKVKYKVAFDAPASERWLKQFKIASKANHLPVTADRDGMFFVDTTMAYESSLAIAIGYLDGTNRELHKILSNEAEQRAKMEALRDDAMKAIARAKAEAERKR